MYALILVALLTGAEARYTGLVWIKTAVCPACQTMEPTVNKLVFEGKPIIIIVVKTQDDMKRYASQLVPTTIGYKGGKVLHKESGVLSEATLRKWLTEVGGK